MIPLLSSQWFRTSALGVCLSLAAADGATFYREADSYSTKCDPDPPRYVTPSVQLPAWLDLGLDYRLRYEYRDDDIRRSSAGADQPLLHRTRFYFGVKEVMDPFRFAFELQDSRRNAGAYPPDNRDDNDFEFIRAYAEVRFDRWFVADAQQNLRPVGLRYGIHNFEFLDRRLLANNQWRNTANAFAGWHGYLGQAANDWSVDLLAVRPLARVIDVPDNPVPGQRVWAMIGHWRGWSDHLTVEPFYLRLDDAAAAGGARVVHSPGLRVFGRFGRSGFDYDATGMVQSGRQGALTHSAWAANAELGYRWDDAWHSRLSVFYGIASGDRDPADGVDQRFERFFGFGRPWSANDYVVFENIIAPKLRFEAQPSPTLRFDFGYAWYALQSAADRFVNGAVARDPSGRSGNDVGHEFDIRLRWQYSARAELTLGYAHFVAGEWTQRVIRPGDTDFAYLQLQLQAF